MAHKKTTVRFQHKKYTHTSIVFSEQKEGKAPVFLKEERTTFEEKTSVKKFCRKPSFFTQQPSPSEPRPTPTEEKKELFQIRIHLPFSFGEEKIGEEKK